MLVQSRRLYPNPSPLARFLVAPNDGQYNNFMRVHDSPGARLRQAWQSGTIAIPGVFNALVAKMAERLGFQAIYLSGRRLGGGRGTGCWTPVAKRFRGLRAVDYFGDFSAAAVRCCNTGFGRR